MGRGKQVWHLPINTHVEVVYTELVLILRRRSRQTRHAHCGDCPGKVPAIGFGAQSV